MVGTYDRTNILLRCIGEVTGSINLLLSLIIKGFTAYVYETSRIVDRLPREGRFLELVFENVKYAILYNYSNGVGEMFDLPDPDLNWTAFARLCERADLVRLRNASEERIVERAEWNLDHAP
jgi:hypothetical protein